VNGDGRDDIVAFGAVGAWVAFGKADGTFERPRHTPLKEFGTNRNSGG
jgi:hypothetical protein